MSREKRFHELIENQNSEKKNAAWERLNSQSNFSLQERTIHTKSGSSLALVKRKNTVWIVSVLSAVLVAALAVFLGVWLTRDKSDLIYRYCTEEDYYVERTSDTLKEYADQIEKEILYFDFYGEWEYNDYVYRLNDNGEIICFLEEIIDMTDEYVITMYVTDNKTEIEAFSLFDTCNEKEQIGSNTLYWSFNGQNSYARFEYKNYNYYLMVVQTESEETILNYARLLLS